MLANYPIEIKEKTKIMSDWIYTVRIRVFKFDKKNILFLNLQMFKH